MEYNFRTRIAHAWKVLKSRDPTYGIRPHGISYSRNPDRPILSCRNERTILNSIMNRIALDVAAVDIKHCRLDENGRFLEEIDSGLNRCLTLEANLDQTSRDFIHDVVLSCMDEGVVAIVPMETDDENPLESNAFDVTQFRVGKIKEWFPEHVRVEVYNDLKGEKDEKIFPKKFVGIIENPFYAVMNERNSTIQRLSRKLALLDYTDENAASGKLDLIIQLPYTVKSETRRNEAEMRRKRLEDQLTSSTKYGVAYVDSTEKIIQLNRSLENNLLKQVEYLTNQALSQLGMTEAILNGTASTQEMINYTNRIIIPFVQAIADELKRKYLTNTARTQKQSIIYFRDPLRMVTVETVADVSDKLTRNEIMTPNEIRQILGMIPSKDPSADELRNRNISESKQVVKETEKQNIDNEGRVKNQNGN